MVCKGETEEESLVSGEVPPGPPRVQIQTQSGCNGRCVFCPNEAVLKSDLKQGRMAPYLFHKIIDELAQFPPRRISPYLMNEPLLDLRLPDFIRYVAQKVPTATTLVTTNGENLKEEIGRGLIDSGLKRLKVSLQSLNPEVNRQLMGPSCDSEKIVRNILDFKRLMREKRAKHLDLRVSMIVTKSNAGEIDETRRFWKKHGIRLVTSALENRGGNIDAAGSLNPHDMSHLCGDCIRPSREMCILWNGDVVLCCVDWWRTTILGNVAEKSVQEIWNGPRLNEIRQALARDDHGALPEICVNCAESARPDDHRKDLKNLLRRWFGWDHTPAPKTCPQCGERLPNESDDPPRHTKRHEGDS